MEIYKKIHLIGIGGIGMSAIAKVLIEKGYNVSGSDIKESSITKKLREIGANVYIGHSGENIKDVDLVVRSTAIPENNPEIEFTKKKGIEILHRAKVLSMLLSEKESIGVTGTHGKGTVSAMIAWILEGSGEDVSFIIGGILNNYGTNAKTGKSRYIVAEVDESDGSLLFIQPNYVVINNVEKDHLNYYNNFENIFKVISQFIENNTLKRKVFINSDDFGAMRVLNNIKFPYIKYGFHTQNNPDFRAFDISVSGRKTSFNVLKNGKFYGYFELQISGIHNIANALSAISVCDWLGVKKEIIQERLLTFKGLKNRFEILEAGRNLIIKDYISHPTGIKRVLESLKPLTKGRVFAIFKPYRFTMVKYLQNEYQEAFRDADFVIITEMWDAGEEPIPGINTEFLVEKIRSTKKRVEYIKEMENINEFLLTHLNPDDAFVFFGGDDLFEIAEQFKKLLENNEN